MTNDQITALAREYAEEIYPHEEGEDLGQMEFLRTSAAKNIEASLKMLSLRFCLVEKENIEKYFQSRNYILTHQDEYAVYIVRESEVEMKLLRCLFPEIAKEVEG